MPHTGRRDPCRRCRSLRKRCEVPEEGQPCPRCKRFNERCVYDNSAQIGNIVQVQTQSPSAQSDASSATQLGVLESIARIDVDWRTSASLPRPSHLVESHSADSDGPIHHYLLSHSSVGSPSFGQVSGLTVKNLPIELRFPILALQSHINNDFQNALKFYSLAKKFDDEPSIHRIQALLLLTVFSFNASQPLSARILLTQAIQMIKYLPSFQDPSNKSHPPEERTAFWTANVLLQVYRICGHENLITLTLDTNRVNPPEYELTSLFPNISNHSSVYYLSSLLDIMEKIARYHSVPPDSLTGLLRSASFEQLTTDLLGWRGQYPERFLLAQTDITARKKEIEGTSILLLNFYWQAAMPILYRQHLLVTGYLDVFSSRLTPMDLRILQTSLNFSIIAALEIAEMNNVLRSAYPDSFWREFGLLIYPMFDAMIVLWFVTCRTLPSWYERISKDHLQGSSTQMGDKDRRHLRDLASGLVKTLQNFKDADLRPPSDAPNVENEFPLLACATYMLAEIEDVVIQTENGDQPTRHISNKSSVDVDTLVLEWQPFSLGRNTSAGDKCEKLEPFAFLGLLGQDVEGGIQWPNEDKWRTFWDTIASE